MLYYNCFLADNYRRRASIHTSEVKYETAIQCLQKSLEYATAYDKFIKDETIEEDNKSFISENFSAIIKNNEDLIKVIEGSLTEAFPIDRIFKIDLAILLVATNELVNYKKTPVKVVINEAVELSKKYSTDKSYSFINGVLAKVISLNE